MKPSLPFFAAALCLLGTVVAEDKPSDVPPELQPLARTAKEQFERHDYPGTESTYRQILEKAPQNLHALSNLGVVLLREQKMREAEEIFQRAIIVAPKDAVSHYTLGVIYFDENKLGQAIAELTSALELDPQNATAHSYLGLAASAKGWKQAAQKEFETVTKLEPSNAYAHFNLAVALAGQKPPDLKNARKSYEIALKLGAQREASLEQNLNPNGPKSYPREVSSLVRKAQRQFGAGDFAGAEQTFREMLHHAPGDARVLSGLGIVLLREGHYRAAGKMLDRALFASPGDSASHCARGVLYYGTRGRRAAIRELKRAVSADPHNEAASGYLAAIRRENTRTKRLCTTMEAALQLDASYDEAPFSASMRDYDYPER